MFAVTQGFTRVKAKVKARYESKFQDVKKASWSEQVVGPGQEIQGSNKSFLESQIEAPKLLPQEMPFLG